MNFSINLPIKEYSQKSLLMNATFFFMSIVALVFISQTYRIIFKSSESLLLLRFTEDYLLLGVLFLILLIKGRLYLNNITPFIFLFGYLSINYLFVVSDFDLVRRFVIMMLWYTIAINIVAYLKPAHFFYIITLMGIFSSGTMLFNIEQTISDYVLEKNRLHAEGEGMDMNINNITLILVALTAIATAMKKNFLDIKYSGQLLLVLYLSVAIILLIGSTRSALLFYFLLVFYSLFGMQFRFLIIPLIVLILAIFTSILFIDELVIISRFVDFDYQSSGRIMAIFNSLSNFADYPFFGVGEIAQETAQINKIGDPDHNFFTRLLGSNGIVGFIFITVFFVGMITPVFDKFRGLLILQTLFFYIFAFSPGGPGIIIIASSIFYISQFKNFDMNLKHS